MAKETGDFYRRDGVVRRAVTWALVAAPLAVAATALLGFVGRTDPALGAGPRLVPLHGHQAQVPPGATLLGPAPSSAVLPLVVTLQPRDQGALAAEAQAVSDPSSPDYHHFLSPEQFAQRYGPTPATIAQVTAQLKQSGLTVGQPASTGLSLPVSGTVAQVQSAFATPIDRYRLSSGKTGYHNRAAPEVPATVAPQIEGILGLDTLSPPHPTTTLPEADSSVPRAGALGVAPALAPGQPAPVAAGNCASDISQVQTSYGALDAVQLAQAYSFDPLYSSGHYGSGTTVALVEMYGAGYSPTDISQFATCYGISLGGEQVTQRTVASGGATGGGTVEAELDIETVLSLAPKANIDVYEGGPTADLYTMFSAIVSDDTAKIVSASWTNGCEAYVPQAYQNSENTLFQTAALEGQSVFVASGDQGAEGCNFNGLVAASTNSQPVAQVADPSTGTLYIANKSSSNVSVDGEGSSGNPSSSVNAATVSTGSGPDAIALDSSDGKVFVANAGSSSLTAFSTGTCNQATTSGCASPTQIASNGHLTGPTALALNGSTLYVANSNGTAAVYNASTNAFVTSVSLPPSSSPTALAVDSAGGVVYVGDAGTVNGIAYFNATTCNAALTTGCSTTPATISLSQHPVSMVVDGAAGSLYVANAGTAGISVVSLSSHTLTTTIPTSGTGIAGTGSAVSVALSPNGTKVLAVLDGLTFPGDVLATINPTTQAIISTVNLETLTDTMGGLAVDGTRDYVWVTDATAHDDVVQNLNLGVTDPASQPYVTAVGGTTVSASALGPAPTETTWNDQLHYAEGAGGGGISQTFGMPAFQQSLGTVSGSSGTPCGNSNGDCREVPDVSADADPSTGYVVYDSVNFGAPSWTAIGGTSGAAPLWAAVLAVAASADGNTGGYGAMNPILYTLAQKSAGTYLNDVTTGNNDYNAANNGQFSASSGYDMATGLGTPVTSALATGLTAIPLDVAVSGSQVYGGTPTFAATPDFGGGSNTIPFGVTLSTTGFSCSEVGTSTAISPALAAASYTLLTSSCGGVSLSGPNASDYMVVYTSAAGDFTVAPGPVDVAVSGSQTYGGSPVFSGTSTPPTGITVTTSGLSCTKLQPLVVITPALPAGSRTLFPGSCAGATLSGTGAADYTVAYTTVMGDFTITPVPLTVTASSASMSYGGTPPTISPAYSGFVNGDTASSLTTKPTCSTTATSASPVAGSPYASSCTGAVDANYSIGYVPGSVTVNQAALTVTAASVSMTYGAAPPVITALYTGFVNGDSATSLTTPPTCSTAVTNASPVAGSPYSSSCSGASDPNYTIGYATGTVTVTKAPLTVTASSASMSYGGAPPAVTPAYSGFVNGDNPSSLTTLATCSTTATSSSPASPPTYPDTCSGASSPNYAVSYSAGATTINRVALTVTASNASSTYGSTPPAIIPGYAGFVNGDTASSLTTKPTCTTTATSSSPVSGSPYPSSCTGAVDANYSIAYVPGAVTVNQAALTVTAASVSMTYGSAPPAITALYTGFVNGDNASSLTTKPTCTTTATNISPVAGSPYSSSCSGAFDPNYAIGYASGAATVTQAPLTVTASSGSMTYGGTPPGVIPAYSGFVNGDTPSSLTAQATCSTTATSSSAASPPAYPTTCTGASGPNYAVSYSAGAITVDPAALTVTASSGSMTYGGAPPAIVAGYAGFVNGDSPASLTTAPKCTAGATGSSPVSGSPYSSSCSGAVDPNYSFVYVPGSVTVNQAALTITAPNSTMTYGSAPPAITPVYGGFVNGDTASSLTTKPTCVTTATSASPVAGSPYSSSCSGAVDANYGITYFPGTMMVNPAPLSVTGSSGSMTYGGTPPVVTPVYNGFKNGDSASSLASQATCSTTATSSSPASPPTYPTTCTGASGPNYAVSYVAGAITINPSTLTVTASSGSMAYGAAPPLITALYTGFVDGDSASSLASQATCSTTAKSSSPVAGSPYSSSCVGGVDPNYVFAYVRGAVTVTPVPLTVTASNASMSYGGAPPTISPAYSGFVNADTASSLTKKPACSTTATNASPVAGSPYSSSCSGAVDANYAITDIPGSVTVKTALLTITASSGSMTYGSSPPAVTAGYSGFKNGDSSSSLTPQPTCSTTLPNEVPVPVSTYVSSCSGASDANYAISYALGLLTVKPAPISVGVVGSQGYGGTPGFVATPPSSLPSGLTAVSTTGITCHQVAPSTAITPTLVGGTYILVPASCGGATLSGPAAADYTVVYATGAFSVTGGPPPPPPPPAHGYWLVGSDGGIFTFGSATFHGSTGSLQLQRPVVGITPTADQGGYWLVASDGGIFAFGDAGFHGSIPGLGLGPAGSGLPNSLNAPIVGMVPSSDGGGYFMVASDGGVFAFGDAQFEGSCPGIGGCSGAAVAVLPDATGKGYWLVTQTGNVYTFGDAPYFGAPGPQGSPITGAVRSADGRGYFVLLANGTVDGYGDAVSLGGPTGAVGGSDPASAVFTDVGGGGYWVASAGGAVFTYGDAPNDGSMAGTHLNGSIIAGTGF